MTLEDRATIIHQVFKAHGFSDIASAGAIGNLQHESNLKPNITETGGFGGYGLAQWTPKENLYTQGNQLGFSRSECEQLEVQAEIIAKATQVGQWTNAMRSNYDVNERISPLTFSNYKKMSDLQTATVNFMGHYLRPTYLSKDNKIYAERVPHAEHWFNFFQGTIPDPDPTPPPEEGDDYEGLDLAQFKKDLKNLINEMLGQDIFKSGNSPIYQNGFIHLLNQLENTYKIKVNERFNQKIDEKFDEFNSGYIPDPDPNPDPDPDPDPDPTNEMYFPVKTNQSGINFWKRDNWGVGTLQRNMTYGQRSNGKDHSGYDIGAGGISGRGIYAVRSGTVTDVRDKGTAGFVIQINHSTDGFHSLYMHLVPNSNLVNVGDSVNAGQKIATMGSSGGNYAIHLHIEISPIGQFHTLENTIDPEPYLKVTADNQTALKIP